MIMTRKSAAEYFESKTFYRNVIVTSGVKRKTIDALYTVSNFDYQVTINN